MSKQQQQLEQYLSNICRIHPSKIDLGLDRIQSVAKQLKLDQTMPTPVITIAGTNGKGSLITILEKIYLSQGYQVASYNSPYFFDVREQIRFQNQIIDAATLLNYLEQINEKRGSVSLTEFEFITLAALCYFKDIKPDIILLEIGMGGRQDAVNIIEPDLAIITNIEMDHQQYLGHTREQIASEKAGIIRTHQPVICGDRHPPSTLIDQVKRQSATLYQLDQDFGYKQQSEKSINWWSTNKAINNLPSPGIYNDHAAIAINAIELLSSKLPVSDDSIKDGLSKFDLRGRTQTIQTQPDIILDVAHNPAAVSLLANTLSQNQPFSGQTLAVFTMLADKDITAAVKIIGPAVDSWYIAPLESERAASLSQLQAACDAAGLKQVNQYSSIKQALQQVLQQANKEDRIIVFGSFYTVASVCRSMPDKKFHKV